MPDLAQLTVHVWIPTATGWEEHGATAQALDERSVTLALDPALAARIRSDEDIAVALSFGEEGVPALVELDHLATEPHLVCLRFAAPALIADTWVGEWMALASP